jgi:hypothetical protein
MQVRVNPGVLNEIKTFFCDDEDAISERWAFQLLGREKQTVVENTCAGEERYVGV